MGISPEGPAGSGTPLSRLQSSSCGDLVPLLSGVAVMAGAAGPSWPLQLQVSPPRGAAWSGSHCYRVLTGCRSPCPRFASCAGASRQQSPGHESLPNPPQGWESEQRTFSLCSGKWVHLFCEFARTVLIKTLPWVPPPTLRTLTVHAPGARRSEIEGFPQKVRGQRVFQPCPASGGSWAGDSALQTSPGLLPVCV